jgi:UDP-N-acetyl-D-mannosaminuronic acid transferase (WecB/TagA/CpsF family)
MDAHCNLNAPMIGVGGAFDFHTGPVVRAPVWTRENEVVLRLTVL